ncbi:hypothetical protein [Streptomyces malaysiense]|uniref:Cellulose synthase n=1 Tax=Streptomyces malaysiense TaxID=1428626 RepID=A0A1J4Q913_9ACTN|nr:hypothetical protein [Streptomyces malaysiense]OIK28854.1 hypothetical protein VT52_004420 [Streptomyces malaysiense]
MIAETVCSAVSAAGLGIAVVTAYRRRFLAAARIAAYALVPVGLVMTGVVGWLSDTAFSPTAWAGFGVLAAAWALFAATRAVERRRGRAGADAEHAAAAGTAAARPAATAPVSSAPALRRGRGKGQEPGQVQGERPASGDDFSDIEAILKKHGI